MQSVSSKSNLPPGVQPYTALELRVSAASNPFYREFLPAITEIMALDDCAAPNAWFVLHQPVIAKTFVMRTRHVILTVCFNLEIDVNKRIWATLATCFIPLYIKFQSRSGLVAAWLSSFLELLAKPQNIGRHIHFIYSLVISWPPPSNHDEISSNPTKVVSSIARWL